MALRIQIAKLKIRQYLPRANLPNLMLTKFSRYTVIIGVGTCIYLSCCIIACGSWFFRWLGRCSWWWWEYRGRGYWRQEGCWDFPRPRSSSGTVQVTAFCWQNICNNIIDNRREKYINIIEILLKVAISHHLSWLPISVAKQCPCRAHEMLVLREPPMAAGRPFQSEKRWSSG